MERLLSLAGLFFLLFIAYLLSSSRKHIAWRTVISGLLLQVVFGFLVLKTTPGRWFFNQANAFFKAILAFTNEGSKFIFGNLVDPSQFGWIFATMVLPTIIFMGSLMAILYHWGIMQKVVAGTAKIMMKVMKTSGAESLAAAANIFVGQTEAPLVIRPYVNSMTQSELMALMSGGMATVAGGVLAAYVGMGIDAGHLMAASVMSAPAALVCAKLLVPETKKIQEQSIDIQVPQESTNVIDAAATGAAEGLKLAVNVGAMLLAFIALIAMFNGLLSIVGGWLGFEGLSFEFLTGKIFAPVAYLLGVPWEDASAVGSLLGIKLMVNEFVAYAELQKMLSTLSPRSITIATYALCGFANFSSIAVQVGGIGILAPKRRKDLARLGIRSLIGGTLACLMTATIAGMLL